MDLTIMQRSRQYMCVCVSVYGCVLRARRQTTATTTTTCFSSESMVISSSDNHDNRKNIAASDVVNPEPYLGGIGKE